MTTSCSCDADYDNDVWKIPMEIRVCIQACASVERVLTGLHVCFCACNCQQIAERSGLNSPHSVRTAYDTALSLLWRTNEAADVSQTVLLTNFSQRNY